MEAGQGGPVQTGGGARRTEEQDVLALAAHGGGRPGPEEQKGGWPRREGELFVSFGGCFVFLMVETKVIQNNTF